MENDFFDGYESETIYDILQDFDEIVMKLKMLDRYINEDDTLKIKEYCELCTSLDKLISYSMKQINEGNKLLEKGE